MMQANIPVLPQKDFATLGSALRPTFFINIRMQFVHNKHWEKEAYVSLEMRYSHEAGLFSCM